MRLLSFSFIFVLVCVSAFAGNVIYNDDITLLALREGDDGKSGTVAKLKLQVIPGNERVYLETYPLTKVSTQASLRFAQQVACKELEVDCSMYDFLFSIESLPGIIGGPSAGSAATLLVSAALLNKSIPDEFALTGTINSGGTIGPVGGLKYKVQAAGNNGIKTVLLPKGTSDFKEDNVSTDLVALGNKLNLSVREVATIRDVLSIVLNVSKPLSSEKLSITPWYEETMKSVANDLCERTKYLEASGGNVSEVVNFTQRAKESIEEKAYYSAASYCFRANLAYVEEDYKNANLSDKELVKQMLKIKYETDLLLNETNSREIQTLTDVQTYMSVRERLDETLSLIRDAAKVVGKNESALSDIAYAQERLFSAKMWSRFFNGTDKSVVINEDRLKSACTSKIAEAEERFNYIVSVIPDALSTTREDIDAAYQKMANKDYVMCLYTAAKAKATSNVLLNLMGVEESRFDEVIDLKLSIVKDDLLLAQKKGVFPIIAYSYYEYASSLKDYDRVSSLLFTEYALELSNFDIYFEKPIVKKLPEKSILSNGVLAFFAGLAIGALVITIGLQLSWNNLQKKHNKISKKSVSSKGSQTQSSTRRRPKGKKR